MGALKAVLWPVQTFNDIVLPVGRWISILAIALMVAAILLQVFMRYVLNNALSWPDEAARFMMLWMTGLMAPPAFRRGGFVAIDMLGHALPGRLAAGLSLVLLAVSAVVLWIGIGIGYAEVTGFGGNFATASLWVPWIDGWFRVPRSWMMASIFVGFVLMFVINIELILRNMLTLLGARDLKPLARPEEELMAE